MRIVRRRWPTPAREVGIVGSCGRFNHRRGVSAEDVVVKLDDAGFIRDVGVLVTWCSVAGPSGH